MISKRLRSCARRVDDLVGTRENHDSAVQRDRTSKAPSVSQRVASCSHACRTTRRRCPRRWADQSAVRVFADKAKGYGIPGSPSTAPTPTKIAAAFAWAVERAREGKGPALIELVCMRCAGTRITTTCCISARIRSRRGVSAAHRSGLCNPELYAYWARAIRSRLRGAAGGGRRHRPGDVDVTRDAEALVEAEARAVIAAPWPDAASAGDGVFAGEPRAHASRGPRAVVPRGDRLRPRRCRRSRPMRRAIRKAARSSTR